MHDGGSDLIGKLQHAASNFCDDLQWLSETWKGRENLGNVGKCEDIIEIWKRAVAAAPTIASANYSDINQRGPRYF